MVQLIDETPSSTRIAIAEGLALLVADTPFGVDLERANYARDAAQNVADAIWLDREVWSARFGGPIALTYRDPESGEVVVGVADRRFEKQRITGQFKVPVTVEYGDVSTQAGSRRNDAGGWTGGNALRDDTLSLSSNPARCTAGFNWRRIADGMIYGSTARHCFLLSGNSTWYHNGRLWGTLAWSSGSGGGVFIDDSLFAAAPGTSWSPTVWIGSSNTADERNVVDSASAFQQAQGSTVALSAGNSGAVVTTIWATANSSKGLLVLTNTSSCLGGDSGAPWYTSFSGSGDIRAFGQHTGQYLSVNGPRCAYRPVHDVSAKLGANLFLVP